MSAAGFACFCAGFLAGASFLPPSVLVVAAAAGLAAALAAPPPGIALISAFSAHSFTLVKEKKLAFYNYRYYDIILKAKIAVICKSNFQM